LRPRRASGLLAPLGVFVGVLAALSVRDIASGEVAVGRLATHLGIIAGLGLVYALARAERALPPDLPAVVVDDSPGREQGPGLRGVA
jgi:predicted anti-sigma-YlaC factor YlaD